VNKKKIVISKTLRIATVAGRVLEKLGVLDPRAGTEPVPVVDGYRFFGDLAQVHHMV
jgi:hypothetical protein